jgi:hypothetical protein
MSIKDTTATASTLPGDDHDGKLFARKTTDPSTS